MPANCASIAIGAKGRRWDAMGYHGIGWASTKGAIAQLTARLMGFSVSLARRKLKKPLKPSGKAA
jgi:hypothetical protein